MTLRSLSIVFVTTLICAVSLQNLFAASLGNHNKRFTNPRDMNESDWSNPAELERSWKAALVRIPTENGKFTNSVIGDLSKPIATIKRYPTIIYLHGCAGVWQGTYSRLNFFAMSGFAVIAPISFARTKYPQSCDVYTKRAGMYRETLTMRQNDAGYAIAKAKQLPWVDTNNVFLVGLSQGGITAATFFSKEDIKSVNARVIEGWTCHSGWDEYKGINAPDKEAILSLVGEKDPWFQHNWTRGDCGKFMKNSNSESVVFKKGYLSTRHELLEDKSVQKIVLDFLKKNIH